MNVACIVLRKLNNLPIVFSKTRSGTKIGFCRTQLSNKIQECIIIKISSSCSHPDSLSTRHLSGSCRVKWYLLTAHCSATGGSHFLYGPMMCVCVALCTALYWQLYNVVRVVVYCSVYWFYSTLMNTFSVRCIDYLVHSFGGFCDCIVCTLLWEKALSLFCCGLQLFLPCWTLCSSSFLQCSCSWGKFVVLWAPGKVFLQLTKIFWQRSPRRIDP